MQKSTAQEVTKFIRNKDEPVQQRLKLAVDVLDGKVDVILPKRELVIAEWLLSVLNSDASFQRSPDTWALLEQCLSKLESDSKQKTLFNGKAHLALLNSLNSVSKTQSADALPNLAKVTKSWNIGIINSIQAKELLCNAAQCVELFTNESEVADLTDLEGWILSLSTQVQAQITKLKTVDEIFDIYSRLSRLPAASVAVLTAIIGPDWFPNPAELTSTQCYSLLKAVVASNIKVGERVRMILCECPLLASRTLLFLPEKTLTQPDLEAIGNELIKSWPEAEDSINVFIQRYPASLSGSATDSLLNTLHEKRSQHTITRTLEVILEALTRNRNLYSKLEARGGLLAKCLFVENSHALDEPLCDAFKALSAKQLGHIISNIEAEFLPPITNALTFDIANTQLVKEALQMRYSSMPPLGKYNTSELGITYTAVPDEMVAPKDFASLMQYLSELESELGPSTALSAKVSIHKSLTLSDSEAILVFRRFKHLISLLPEKQIKRITQQLKTFDWLGDDLEIFEYENLAALILESCLQDDTSTERLILQLPQEAMPAAVLSNFVAFALSSADMKIFSQVLSWNGASHVLAPVVPGQILALTESLDLSDLKGPFEVFKLLLQKGLLPQELEKELKFDNLRHVVLALAYPEGSAPFENAQLALQSPSSSGLVRISAFALANNIVRTDGVSSEYLALVASRMHPNDTHASQIFQLMVERSFDFMGLTAFFVKCEHSFQTKYSEYVSSLSPDKQELLMLEALSSRQYGLAKCLLASINSKELAIAHFGRMLALSNETLAQHADDQLTDLLEAISSILTESGWLVSQFAVEQILYLLVVTSKLPFCITNFRLLSEVLSRVILFHRHRLTGRAHLLIVLLSSMLNAISTKGLQLTKNFAEFARLIKTLCQGQTKRGRGEKDQSLTSSNARARKNTGRLAGSLLATYIHLSIRGMFEVENGKLLREPVFDLLKTMSKSNINVFTTYLDDSGRALFKQIYNDYIRQNRQFSAGK